jgi:hypothetical protein
MSADEGQNLNPLEMAKAGRFRVSVSREREALPDVDLG